MAHTLVPLDRAACPGNQLYGEEEGGVNVGREVVLRH